MAFIPNKKCVKAKTSFSMTYFFLAKSKCVKNFGLCIFSRQFATLHPKIKTTEKFSWNQTASKFSMVKQWVQVLVPSVKKLFMSTIFNKKMKNWSFWNKATVPNAGGLYITTLNGRDRMKVSDLRFTPRRPKQNIQWLNVDISFIHLAWPRKLIVNFVSLTSKVSDLCITMLPTRIRMTEWMFKIWRWLSKTWTKSWWDSPTKWIDCNIGCPEALARIPKGDKLLIIILLQFFKKKMALNIFFFISLMMFSQRCGSTNITFGIEVDMRQFSDVFEDTRKALIIRPPGQ